MSHAPYPPITPYLAMAEAAKAVEFYKTAFNATERFRLTHPESGKLCHAELHFYGGTIMLADEHPQYSKSPTTLGGTAIRLCLTVDNVDAVVERAVKAGATVTMPAADQFYGMRSAGLRDPSGHEWMIQHEIEKVSPPELQRRFNEMVQQS
jgi:PhnB protein